MRIVCAYSDAMVLPVLYGRILRVLLLLLVFVQLCSADCMSQYRLKPSSFSMCEEKECLIFRTEIPFVFMDPSMTEAKHQLPFRCAERGELYPKLDGPFFDIIDKMVVLSNSYCVWAGPGCEFDGMVDFLSETAVSNSSTKPKLRFIAGGLLFMLQYRMTVNSIPSAPLLEDQLIVVGPRKDDNATWAKAWEAMWRPFTTKSWIMLLMTIIFVIFLRVWASYFFTTKQPRFNWKQFRNYLVGDYDDVNSQSNRKDSQSRKLKRHSDPREVKRLNSYISNGMGIFFVITILYYEIAVVDFVFEERQDSMEGIEPQNFVILNKSTQDHVFEQQFSNRRGCRTPCWKNVATTTEVYETIYNDSKHNKFRYTVAYETFNRYHFKENTKVCNRLAVLEYKEVNRRFAGVWYYSSNIPRERRMMIDKTIVRLREEDKIRSIVHFRTGSELPPQCQTSGSISVLLLSLPLAILPGPIFAIVFFYLVLYTLRRRQDEREARENNEGSDTENPDYSEDTTISNETTTYASRPPHQQSALDSSRGEFLKIPRSMYIPRA